MTRGPGDQHGSATVQLTVVTPAVLLSVLLVVQMALWMHGSHVVTAAAQEGAAAAQREPGDAAAARRAVAAFLGTSDRGLLRRPRVTVAASRDRARVVVRARIVSLVPGLRLRVQGIADGPKERFRSRLER